MGDMASIPQIGQLARALRGRDTDKLAIVIGVQDERFVLIADGDKRRFDSPKKKNINHLQLYDFISADIRDSIEETGRVPNAKLRDTVRKFSEQIDTAHTE